MDRKTFVLKVIAKGDDENYSLIKDSPGFAEAAEAAFCQFIEKLLRLVYIYLDHENRMIIGSTQVANAINKFQDSMCGYLAGYDDDVELSDDESEYSVQSDQSLADLEEEIEENIEEEGELDGATEGEIGQSSPSGSDSSDDRLQEQIAEVPDPENLQTAEDFFIALLWSIRIKMCGVEPVGITSKAVRMLFDYVVDQFQLSFHSPNQSVLRFSLRDLYLLSVKDKEIAALEAETTHSSGLALQHQMLQIEQTQTTKLIESLQKIIESMEQTKPTVSNRSNVTNPLVVAQSQVPSFPNSSNPFSDEDWMVILTQLQAAKLHIFDLEMVIEKEKSENARLREKLDVKSHAIKQVTEICGVFDDSNPDELFKTRPSAASKLPVEMTDSNKTDRYGSTASVGQKRRQSSSSLTPSSPWNESVLPSAGSSIGYNNNSNSSNSSSRNSGFGGVNSSSNENNMTSNIYDYHLYGMSSRDNPVSCSSNRASVLPELPDEEDKENNQTNKRRRRSILLGNVAIGRNE